VNDLRGSLEELAERGSPRPVDEVAAEVERGLAAGGGRRVPWMVIAAAAAVVAAVVGIGMARLGDEDAGTFVDTGTTTTQPGLSTSTTMPGETTTTSTEAGTGSSSTTASTAPPREPGAWQQVDPATLPRYEDAVLQAVASDGKTLVAVGAALGSAKDAVVLYSTDGVRWEQAAGPFGGPGFQYAYGVAAGPSGFVVVGSDGPDIGQEDAAVWRSADGRTWTRVPDPGGAFGGSGGQIMQAVAFKGHTVVAVGIDVPQLSPFDGAVWTSADAGVTWKRVRGQADLARPSHEYIKSVAATGSGFMAVGWDHHEVSAPPVAAAWASPDGTQWRRVTVEGASPHSSMNSVTAGPSGLVAVGRTEWAAGVWRSADGQRWNLVPDDPKVFGQRGGSMAMHAVASTPTGFVAVGIASDAAESAWWRSTDGRTWSRQGRLPPDPWGTPHGVTAHGGTHVAVGYANRPAEPNGDPSSGSDPAIWYRH